MHRRGSDEWAGVTATWVRRRPTPVSFGPRLLFDVTSPETIVGEVGRVTTLTHAIKAIQLNHTYNNLIVFAQPASFAGADPIVARVTDVQSN